MGGVRSKCRSLGQIVEKPSLHSRSNIFGPIFLKFAQDVCLGDISEEFDNVWGRFKK